MDRNTSKRGVLSQKMTREQRTLMRLREQTLIISRRLARHEAQYRDLGIVYFAIRHDTRLDLVQNNDIHDTFNSAPHDPALIVNELNDLRLMRDELRDALRRGDVQRTNEILGAADRALTQTQRMLDPIQEALSNIVSQVQADPDRWGVLDLPQLAPGTTIGPNEAAVFGEQYNLLRDWVLSLPEVSTLIERGVVTADEAFIDTLRVDEDRDEDVVEDEGRALAATAEDTEESREDGGRADEDPSHGLQPARSFR